MNKCLDTEFRRERDGATYDSQFGIMVNSLGGLCSLGYAYEKMRLEPKKK